MTSEELETALSNVCASAMKDGVKISEIYGKLIIVSNIHRILFDIEIQNAIRASQIAQQQAVKAKADTAAKVPVPPEVKVD